MFDLACFVSMFVFNQLFLNGYWIFIAIHVNIIFNEYRFLLRVLSWWISWYTISSVMPTHFMINTILNKLSKCIRLPLSDWLLLFCSLIFFFIYERVSVSFLLNQKLIGLLHISIIRLNILNIVACYLPLLGLLFHCQIDKDRTV